MPDTNKHDDKKQQGITEKESGILAFLNENATLTARQIYQDILQVSKPTFWRMVKDNDFPKGFKINKRDYRWSIKTVKDWQEQRAK